MMNVFRLAIDNDYLVRGEVQTICTTDKEIRKSFIREDFPVVNEKLTFLLEEDAQLTDCLSPGNISARGFLINDRLRKLFEGFNIMNHKYYDAVVIDKDDIAHSYYWMQLNENLTHCIDFPNSKFIEMDITREIGPLILHSFNEYSQKRKEIGWEWDVKATKLAIKPKTQIEELDMFRLFPFTPDIYISERLKEAISNSDITGLMVKENVLLEFE